MNSYESKPDNLRYIHPLILACGIAFFSHSCGYNTNSPKKAYFSDEKTLIVETLSGRRHYLIRQVDGFYVNIANVEREERKKQEQQRHTFRENLESKTNALIKINMEKEK